MANMRNPSHFLHLVKGLPHADQSGAAAGGINHGIRQVAAHLLVDLVSHGLLALDAIRFAQG
jgi:hypothetical protein